MQKFRQEIIEMNHGKFLCLRTPKWTVIYSWTNAHINFCFQHAYAGAEEVLETSQEVVLVPKPHRSEELEEIWQKRHITFEIWKDKEKQILNLYI